MTIQNTIQQNIFQITYENYKTIKKEIKENNSLCAYFICEKCHKKIYKEARKIINLYKRKKCFICQQCNLKNTFQQKYNVDNISQLESIKKKKLEKLSRKTQKEKQEITYKKQQSNLKKYGVTSPLQVKTFREKFIATLQKNYGVSNPSKSKQIQLKKQLNHREQQKQAIINKLIDVEWLDSDTYTRIYDKQQIYYTFKCKNCNTIFKDYLHSHLPTCPKCYPGNVSRSEKEIVEYIKSIYNGKINENDRSIIAPKELDIYLPELKIAVEYNGTYWHGYTKNSCIALSDFKKEIEYKRLQCQKLNIRLITIDEVDYENNRDVYKRFISDTILPRTRIFARKCEIKEINKKIAKEFCEYYHVNGFRGGSFRYGLYYNNELLAVAIFAKYKDVYECTRLCYKTGYDIIGGWAKIQKHFGKKFLHYVNLKYFQGENKTGIGFRFVLKGNKVLHRNAVQKKTGLYKYCTHIDKTKSDFENCLNNNMTAIFDLGNDIRWYNT